MDKKKVANRKEPVKIGFHVSVAWHDNFKNYLLDHGIKSKKDWLRQAAEEKMERDS